MSLDHLSFGTRDLIATRQFYEGQLGFPVLIHEWMLKEEGSRVDHMFFDCDGGCALAFMQGLDMPGMPSKFDAGINRGLGLPRGPFHFALRCSGEAALQARRLELINRGMIVGQLIELDPYHSFFVDDPVNGLRLEYTTRLRTPIESYRDPQRRQFQASLALFERAAQPTSGQ